MTSWTRSIAARLGIAIAAILGIGAIVLTLAAYAYGRQAADQAFDRMLAGAALQINENILARDGVLIVDLPAAAFELLALARDDRIFYRIVAPDGSTVTGYDELPLPSAPQDGSPRFYDGTIGGAEVRLVSVAHRFAERDFRGTVSVIVAHTTLARAALARDITAKALLLILVAGIAMVALTFLAVRLSLAPLARIERTLGRRDPKDLSPLEVPAPREIETTVAAINRFMSRLANRVAMMQSFIAEATHQLRTPITAMRAQAELATEESDPDRLRQIAGKIHRRAVGMSRLADQLLSHALIIHRSEATPLQEVDLREVALEAAEESEFAGRDGTGAATLNLPDQAITVTGDAVSLTEAVKNLLNNAYRYGRAPVAIAVERRAPDESAAIAVIDQGPGISEELWPSAGQRFVRGKDPASDGAGLGLAIVAAVAEAHGGRLAFSRPESGGFRVAIEIPARSEGRMA